LNSSSIDRCWIFSKALAGLYSKRQFKMLIHARMKRQSAEVYGVIVFSLQEMNALIPKIGHDAAQEALRNLGLAINRHFGIIGGMSTRRNTNEFISMLPHADLAETESLLREFVKDFETQTLDVLKDRTCRVAAGDAADLAVLAGIAEGRNFSDVNETIIQAKMKQHEIARLRCAASGENR